MQTLCYLIKTPFMLYTGEDPVLQASPNITLSLGEAMGTRPLPISYIFIPLISLSKQELGRSLPLIIRKIRQEMRDKRRRGKSHSGGKRHAVVVYSNGFKCQKKDLINLLSSAPNLGKYWSMKSPPPKKETSLEWTSTLTGTTVETKNVKNSKKIGCL